MLKSLPCRCRRGTILGSRPPGLRPGEFRGFGPLAATGRQALSGSVGRQRVKSLFDFDISSLGPTTIDRQHELKYSPALAVRRRRTPNRGKQPTFRHIEVVPDSSAFFSFKRRALISCEVNKKSAHAAVDTRRARDPGIRGEASRD